VNQLQISGKDLGALAMKGFCPRCFWIQRRTKLPWQIFPGIFSSIDSYSKKVVHGQFDKSGMPGWLDSRLRENDGFWELKGYKGGTKTRPRRSGSGCRWRCTPCWPLGHRTRFINLD